MNRKFIHFNGQSINSDIIYALRVRDDFPDFYLILETPFNGIEKKDSELFTSAKQAEEKITKLISSEGLGNKVIKIFDGHYIFKDKISVFGIRQINQEERYISRILMVNGDHIEESLGLEKSAQIWLKSVLKQAGDKKRLFFFSDVYCFKNKVGSVHMHGTGRRIVVDVLGNWTGYEDCETVEEAKEKMCALVKEIES
ncbi:MAG: hypothetical protein ACOYMB_04145 [Patescibacteria group bacterium]